MDLKTALRKGLFPLSFFYGFAVKLRNWGYDSHWFSVQNSELFTISIGNISAGGTGKTPFAAYLIDFLLQKGYNLAYLSRGYGRASKGFRLIDRARPDAQEYGDEPLEIASKFMDLPVAVCEDRVAGAKELKSRYPNLQILVLDDAMQHRRIYRDWEAVMVDANALPYDDGMLPSGNLREPLKGLYRADVVVVNKLSKKEDIPLIFKNLQPYLSATTKLAFACPSLLQAIQIGNPNSVLSLSEIEQAVVISGIGNPHFFAHQLQQKGIQIVQKFDFPDHHVYTENEVQNIVITHPQLPILTTQKDATRLASTNFVKQNPNLPLFYVPMQWHWWQGKNEMEQALLETIEQIMG